MTQELLEPFFFGSPNERLFGVLRRAAETDRCVIFVPPFAEEMNKCRRQVTETARLLAAHGYSTLVIDLYGTGESSGDFCDATWGRWQENIASAFRWASSNNLVVNALVATRIGCTLAADTLAATGLSVGRSIFLQPIEDGSAFLDQFLRLGAASSILQGKNNENTNSLKQRLQNGETIEIGGYPLSSALAEDINRLKLSDSLCASLGKLWIFEVGRAAGVALSPDRKCIESAALQKGISTSSDRILGQPYWSSTEIVVDSDLCQTTVDAIVGGQ